jgi:hypothetical protein
MRNLALFMLALSVLAVASPADAQVRRVNRGNWYRNPGINGFNNGYGSYGGYSSTPVEGARRGMADMIRASGEAAEAGTRAMNNYEEARTKYIDNKMKFTETYWARKRLGEAELKKDHDRKRKGREAYLATKGSGFPPRLSPAELDPSTGTIYWPQALMGDRYAELRKELDEVFQLGFHTGSLRQYDSQISQISRSMRSELKKHIRDMATNEYIASRKFLDSLAYEGRYPIG